MAYIHVFYLFYHSQFVKRECKDLFSRAWLTVELYYIILYYILCEHCELGGHEKVY